MDKDQQRLIVNKICNHLLDMLDNNKNVTSEFNKMYDPQGETNVKNRNKSLIKDIISIGLPDLGNNVMDGDEIRDKFKDKNGSPDKEKMADVTNRAAAITHAFAILQELIPIHDTVDDYKKRIEDLESKVSKLESDVKYLKNRIN